TKQEGLNGFTPSNTQGSYHPNDLGQQLLGSVLQPYVEQAVNNQLSKQGMQGAENVAPITPTFSYLWNLRVDVPLQSQGQPPAGKPHPPAQDTPPQPAPSDQPAEKDKNQPDGAGQAKPDTPKPEAAQPKPDQPGTPQPEAAQPKADQPDAPQPEAPQPNTS